MEDEDTALHEAVRYGAIEEVQSALECGDDPNAIGFYRWSSLHEAVSIDDEAILQLLLEHGGDANIPDNCNGSTPVHMAAKQGSVKCLALLLSHGGDVNQANRDNKTAQDVATGTCVGYLVKIEQERLVNTSHTTRCRVLEQGQGRRHKQLQSLTTTIGRASSHSDVSLAEKHTLSRPPSSLSVRSVTSVRSAESVLTTRSSPVRGPAGQRTTRKPPGANTSFVNKAPGVRLSVEYSEETCLLKIRAWSVQFVTLPGDVASANSTLHLRACVFPGSKIWSKTEDIPIEKYLPAEDAESGRRMKRNTFDSPVTLQPVPLDRKMTFKAITEAELADKNIELVLCCKTPAKIANKLHHIAKLFLKCNEAVNVVMPKWFLMTSCSIDKSKQAQDTQFRNPVFGSRPNSAGANETVHPVEGCTNIRLHPSSKPAQGPAAPLKEDHSSSPRLASPSPRLASSSPRLSSPSIASISNVRLTPATGRQLQAVKITHPLETAPPPINKISSSISMKNPFRRDKSRGNYAKAGEPRGRAGEPRGRELETRIAMGELEARVEGVVEGHFKEVV